VDHQVDVAGCCDGPAKRVGIGGVGDDESGADLLGGGPQLRFAARSQDNVVAEFCESAAARLTDTATATGDQCGSQRSSSRHPSLSARPYRSDSIFRWRSSSSVVY
jgi:hypothetical protein